MQKTPVFLYLYRSLFAPVAILMGLVAMLFHAKFRQSVLLKLKTGRPRHSGGVWIHTASGEFEYAKPLLPLLSARFSNLLVTYTSPSYKKNIESSPFVTESGPLPLDLPGPITSFLNVAKPKMILIARTDLWPELIWQAKKRGIPTYVFAVTEKPQLLFTSRLAGRIKALIYNQTSGIFCVSEEDRKILLSMGVTQPIHVLGDPRIDQALSRAKTPNKKTRQLPTSEALTITLGSTWPEDERILLPDLEPLLSKKGLRVLWAPHEPSESHFEQQQKRLQHLGISLTKYSEFTAFEPGNVLYVDVVGVLADLYAYSQVAFVGGSFKANVHSVMEPLAHGNWVWVGPKNQNNREAQVFKSYSSPLGLMVLEFKTATELQTLLEQARSTQKNIWDEHRQQSIEKLMVLQGASQKIVERL